MSTPPPSGPAASGARAGELITPAAWCHREADQPTHWPTPTASRPRCWVRSAPDTDALAVLDTPARSDDQAG